MTDSTYVQVTEVQRLAAQEIIARAERFGRDVDPVVAKIANARRVSAHDMAKQVSPSA